MKIYTYTHFALPLRYLVLIQNSLSRDIIARVRNPRPDLELADTLIHQSKKISIIEDHPQT